MKNIGNLFKIFDELNILKQKSVEIFDELNDDMIHESNLCEMNYVKWTINDVFMWFKYKMIKNDINNIINWDKIKQKMFEIKLNGKYLNKFIQTSQNLKNIGFNNFQLRQKLFEYIQCLKDSKKKNNHGLMLETPF